jgi:hypothetical protein
VLLSVVELHNRFIVAVLDQAQANSKSLGSDLLVSKRPLGDHERPIDIDTRGNTAAKEMTKELSEKAAKPTGK